MKIACEFCQSSFVVTGDGSATTRKDHLGGHYFCCEKCAQHWEKAQKAAFADGLAGVQARVHA